MLRYSCKLQEEKIPPKPFVYEYGHVDPSGLASAKTESQDADGVVRGKTNVLFSMEHLICKRFSRKMYRKVVLETRIFFLVNHFSPT